MVDTALFETTVSSTDSPSNTDNSDEFTERRDDFEGYDGVCQILHYLGKFVRNTDEISYDMDEGVSPIIDEAADKRAVKNDMSDDFEDMRESGELSDDQHRGSYRESFPEPDFEYQRINADNASDFGLSSDQFDDDEEILLPEDFDMPAKDGSPHLLWDTDTDANDICATMKQVDQVGKKRSGKLLNCLQDDGFLPDDLSKLDDCDW